MEEGANKEEEKAVCWRKGGRREERGKWENGKERRKEGGKRTAVSHYHSPIPR